MKPFINETTDGNEYAIKRGERVPDGAINLAWAKGPTVNPKNNIIVLDTSRITPQNAEDDISTKKLMYADVLGVLQDEFGNQIVDEEFPLISDVFTIDEDFIAIPGSEYSNDDILPFVHVSRYFHVDFTGLTLGTAIQTFHSEKIKVVDSTGKDYVDAEGLPRYRVTITPAFSNTPSNSSQGAYRIFAFVDDGTNEELYLKYNKVELDATTGLMKNQEIAHQEILNPQPYFQYVPEESDVVDFANKKQKIYSTKPVKTKDHFVGLNRTDADGYKVYVPRKAIPDPRLFQLFRWRVNCEFTQTYKTDPIKNLEAINCGVVVTNEIKSICPYSFLNLWKSQWNISGVQFLNPIKGPTPLSEKETADYWEVNIDEVSLEDLQKFDILIWSPAIMWFDYGPYLSKIQYFTDTVGGTLFIDTANYSAPANLGIIETSPSDPFTGSPTVSTPNLGTAVPTQSSFTTSHPLFDGNTKLGGWDFNDDDASFNYESFSFYTNTHSQFYNTFIQYIDVYPADYNVIVEAPHSGDLATPLPETQVIIKPSEEGGGNIIFSCNGPLVSTSSVFSAESGWLLSLNRGNTRSSLSTYYSDINSFVVMGAYKFLYNACLLAVRGKLIDDKDETTFSSVWSKPSKWFASWVINADNNILSDDEKSVYHFAFLPKGPDDPTPVWQRKLIPKTFKQVIYDELTDDDIKRLAGASRSYTIEVTNAAVEVQTSGLSDNNVPYAWTTAYSPPFEVPVELGPNVIREEPTQGQYESGQFLQKEYPPKPYQLQVQATYISTADQLTTEVVNWTAYATATRNIRIPPQTTTTTADTTLSWREFGSNITYENQWDMYEFGLDVPYGVRTWQNSNYYTNAWGPGNLNWPHFAFFIRLDLNSTGEAVEFAQYCLNQMQAFGFIDTGSGYLAQDGYYGNLTKNAVYNMQTTFNARYLDGVIDAESWSIIGNQALRFMQVSADRGNPILPNNNDISRFLSLVLYNMQRANISDGSDAGYLKRSWVQDGPPIIWELFCLTFNQPYNIHGVTVVPYLTGDTKNLMFRSVHITNLNNPADQAGFMQDYDSKNGQLIYMPFRPSDGEHFYVPVGPYLGNTLVVGIGQDQGSGFGSARELGVRDILAHAIVTQTTTTPGRLQQDRIVLSDTGTARCKSRVDVIQKAHAHYDGPGWLTDLVWNPPDHQPGIVDDNPDISTNCYPDGTVVSRNNMVENDIEGGQFTFGPLIPEEFNYFAMTTEGEVLPGYETGFVSKSEGVKLLCDSEGNPIGFPDLPTNFGDSDKERHYGIFTLTSTKSDHSVQYGFYDRRAKEFVTGKNGRAEMSYLEYESRGPSNIYIAVYSTYEVLHHRRLPPADDAPVIPFRWAMPVYGVSFHNTSRIGIDPLPDNLDVTDVWPVPIRLGKFNRVVHIRSRTKNPLTTYIKNYEDTNVKAYYTIPEAWNAAWSKIFGRPYYDVLGEHPVIESELLIKVRQAPVFMAQEPGTKPSNSDPMRPVLKVYQRATVEDDWVQINLKDIKDFNASTGEIYLNIPLQSLNPALLKVDYTSAKQSYALKQVDGEKINLNPYLAGAKDLINKPIYIYLLPYLVRDKDGKIIDESVNHNALQFTLKSDIFNPTNPDYDPLAIQLGIVYITTNLDISQLSMLDTRSRGGGAQDGLTLGDLSNIINDAKGYWDMGTGMGQTYQKSGFVLIRLPEALKDQFPEKNDIINIIRRNMTAGVEFRIETLEGNPW